MEVAVGTTLSLDWLPTDETSKFGGTYRLATYTGTPIEGLDETGLNFAGNIGEAYVGGVDFEVDLGGSDYAVDLLLYDLLAADVNLDGLVDGLDFSALVGNWHAASGKTWAEAGFNMDGNVDGLNFSALVGSRRTVAGPRPLTYRVEDSPARGLPGHGLSCMLSRAVLIVLFCCPLGRCERQNGQVASLTRVG